MRTILQAGLLLLLIGWTNTRYTLAAEIVFEKDIEYSNPDNQHLQLNLARPKEAAGRMPAVSMRGPN